MNKVQSFERSKLNHLYNKGNFYRCQGELDFRNEGSEEKFS